jgi:hypothetical protein
LPEAAWGRPLLNVLSAIGYDPEDMLRAEVGTEKVALVFAYPDARLHKCRDGRLPREWQRHVYPATWENLFALMDHLVAEKGRVEIRREGWSFRPTKIILCSERERAFLVNFPESGKRRVASTPYPALRCTGGPDWKYRSLLDRLLGASEHFRGNGTTKLTLGLKGKAIRGFPEFLGPNRELKGIRDLAIVSLGTLKVSE